MNWNGLDLEQVTELLGKLIRCESPDPPGNERLIATELTSSLEQLGFEVDLDEFAPNRFNVLSRIKGEERGQGLVFSAHMDTLPAGNGDWLHPPFSGQVDDGRIYGRGAIDMKSGLTAMVSAATAIKRDTQQGSRLKGDLVLAFTGGESSNCLGAHHLAATRALDDCNALLVSEPSSLDVLIAEQGALWLKATATGITGHVSGGGESVGAGRSAILEMMAFIDAVPAQLPNDSHPLLGQGSVNIGKIEGGTAINLMPDECIAEIDIRLLPNHDADTIQQALTKLAGEHIQIERLDHKPAVETSAEHPFVQICIDATTQVRGESAAPQGVSYFSDACVLSPAFDLPMVIIGPGQLGGSGSLNESCSLADVDCAARIYYQIAHQHLACT